MAVNAICAHSGREKDVDNRPELFLCCGKDDRLVYDAVEKLENALQKENITHEYRSGHGDHEFFYWEQMMDPGIFFSCRD